jgi:hypothetical protein
MIYAMAKDIATGLHTRKWPVAVEYAGARITHGNESLRVCFERDCESGDGVGPVRGEQRNPRKQAARTLGVIATVFVQSPKDGARRNEHEHLCDDLVDALICEIGNWGTVSKAGDIPFTESRYLLPEEMANEYSCSTGVIYRLRFHVSRGVFTRDFDGSALGEATPAITTITTKVSPDGETWETAD